MSTRTQRILQLAAVLPALAFSTGCSTWSKREAPPPPDPILQSLETHAGTVRNAWIGYSGLAAQNGGVSTQVPPATFPLESMPEALRVAVDVEWHGELEPAAQALAEYIGWSFSSIGARPSQPILVMLASDGEPVGALLRSLGQQAGARANLIVRVPTKSVEVVYR